MIAADLDRDGDLDLAVANSDLFTRSMPGVAILFNDGRGSFPSTTELEVGRIPASVRAGDVDGDGDTDLVVANLGSNSVSVLHQGDTGAFGVATFATGGNPNSLALADLDLDGDLDVATANWGLFGAQPKGVTLLRNDGTGGLSDRIDMDVGVATSSVAALDLDGDGRPDLAATAFDGGTVALFRNRGGWRFDEPVREEAGFHPLHVFAADLDLDGDSDLAIANQCCDGRITLLRNDSLPASSPDCNSNDVPDECDIAGNLVGDENRNGVPDGCEDCDENGVPDEVDVTSGASRDCNENGLPDACEPAAVPCAGDFVRGDCNDDHRVNISDTLFVLGALFLGRGDPGCDDACDSNDDGAINVSDVITTLGVLFLGQGRIPLPGIAECGVDPTDDLIRCERYESCP